MEGRDDGIAAANADDPPFAIAIEFPGHALHVVQPVVPGFAGGEFVEIRLEPEHVLAGRVVDVRGSPIVGARVWIEGDREMETGVSWGRRNTWEFCYGIADGETDLLGRFRFNRLYAGDFTVRAAHPDDPHRTVEAKRPSGDEAIELVLDPAVTSGVVLFGEVRDARTGDGVQDFDLLPWIGQSAIARSFETEDGRYEVSGLPAGEIQITFRAPGYAATEIPFRHYAEGRHRLDVELRPPRSLELWITDEHGVAHEHGTIQVLDPSGQVLWLEEADMGTSSVRIRDGKVTLRGVPAGSLTLRILIPGPDGILRSTEIPVDMTFPHPEPYPVAVPR